MGSCVIFLPTTADVCISNMEDELVEFSDLKSSVEHGLYAMVILIIVICHTNTHSITPSLYEA